MIPLIAGYVLDLLLGDPDGMPHPIRFFGLLISKGEANLNKGRGRFLKGLLLTAVLSVGVFGVFYVVERFLGGRPVGDFLWICIATVLVFFGLANRQLIREGNAVFSVLSTQGPAAARVQLSRIVGRDTTTLGPQRIKIAVLETLAENLNDAVVAPLFYYAVAGVPGMMAYKMVNTMDSMIGYRSIQYEQFGKAAARLDDVLNFIPARLTALLMVLVSVSVRGMRFVYQYGSLHKSPNAGYPEAALAGILNVRFGGPNMYKGVLVEKPFIGEQERPVRPEDLEKAVRINHGVCLLTIIIILWLNIF